MAEFQYLDGQVVDGHYRLGRSLGSGTFGRVFEAEELVGGEVVGLCAVKLLQPRDSEARKLVLEEMRAGAFLTRGRQGLLSHLAFGEVPEPGPLQGCLYLSMELAEESLADRLKTPGRLGVSETGQMMREVADALAWLHEQGVVHRDIKPDNVLYVGGHWKLGDLGLVRRVDGALVQTVTRVGTPLYMAPEVLEDLVGPSVDVWALGVLLQECLTGVLPYTGRNDAVVYGALATREPTIAPDLPSPFDAVVRGCLVKDPRKRWTAQQVLKKLDGSSPAVARPVVVSGPRSEVVSSAPRGLVALGRNAQGRERFQVEGGGPVLVSLPAGRFTMGSPAGEEGRDGDETQHEVVLSRGFLLGEAPVTQAEYTAVVGSNPSMFSGNSDHPVECVSWFEAVSFCNALSRRVGLEEAYVVNGTDVTWKGLPYPGFRLPTEAEWEYACRAGTTGARYGDLRSVAWYDGNSGRTIHPVRQKQPNAWGLYDTLGNVCEWCWDWFSFRHPSGVVWDPVGRGDSSLYRVTRGGSYRGGAEYARAANRRNGPPDDSYYDLGFRLARLLP